MRLRRFGEERVTSEGNALFRFFHTSAFILLTVSSYLFP
jgi:hypothetical protein